MAQCAGFIAMKVIDAKAGDAEKKKRLVFFATIDNVKFRTQVKPGDRLDYEVEILKLSTRVGKFRGITKVNGEVAAEADMMAVISEQK